MSETIAIADLAKWSAPKRVETKAGPRMLRTAAPEEAFWNAWRSDKDALRAAGVSCTKNARTGNWEACWWLPLDEAEKSKLENALAASRAVSADIEIPKPDGKEYLPFQLAGIAYALGRDKTLIGDSMGLGKTIQAIGYINAKPEIKKVLIVCPASLRLNWRNELNAWLTRPFEIVIVDGGKAEDWAGGEITIINFDVAHKHRERIDRHGPYDLLIIDEAQNLRNGDTLRAKAVYGAKAKRKKKKGGGYDEIPAVAPISANRALALTGTPLVNRPKELFTFLEYVDPEGMGKNFFSYAKKFCAGHKTRFGWDFSGASNLDLFQRTLREKFMVRRLKEDVLKELPPKRWQVIEIPRDTEAAKVIHEEKEILAKHEEILAKLEAAVELAKASDDPADYTHAIEALRKGVLVSFTDMSKVRHETGMVKVPYVIEHLESGLEEGPIFCFAQHKKVIGAMAEHFGDRCYTLTGDTPMAARQAAVDGFQAGERPLFLGNIDAAGVGITLTRSAHVVGAEGDWVPGKIAQVVDRCVLEGQPVLTPNGWVPIEQIEVGDFVISHDGLPHPVIDTWSRKARGSHAHNSKEIVELAVRGWPDAIKVTHDHRILTNRGWIEAQDIRPRDRIVMPYKNEDGSEEALPFDEDCMINRQYVHKEMIREGGKPIKEHVRTNVKLKHAPEKIELTEDAMFVFGYYIGDGFSKVGGKTESGQQRGQFVSFAGHQKQKKTHLKACAEWMKAIGINASVYEDKRSFGCEMRAYSAEMAKWFAKHFGRKLTEKKLPEWLFAASKKLRRAFVKGWLASDGYVRPSLSGAMRYEIVTASQRLAADACRLLMGIGLKPCVTRGSTGQMSIQYTEGEHPSLVVQSVLIRTCNKTERVHDLTVAGAATFVIGTGVVHNCHRIGQVNSVLVQLLVLEGSIDAAMAHKCVAKQAVISAALDNMIELDWNAPTKEHSATALIKVKQIAKEAVDLTPAQVDAVHLGLRMLAGMCDGAQQLDNRGFNKIDSYIWKSLAEQSFLSKRQAVLGRKIARKYVRQIGTELVAAMGVEK